MAVRKTVQWLVIIVLLGSVSGGAYVYSLWQRSDELLHARILDTLDEIAPEWNIRIGRARFDWSRRVRLNDVAVKTKSQSRPIVVLPEIVLTLDRERFLRDQQVVIHKVQMHDPVIDLIRDVQGGWNWQALPPLPILEHGSPEWKIEGGTVRLHLEQADGSDPTTVAMRDTDLRLIPSGKQQFLVNGLTRINGAGFLHVAGRWDLTAESWTVQGKMEEVSTSGELLALAAEASAEFRAGLGRIADALDTGPVVSAGDSSREDHSPFSLVARQDSDEVGEPLSPAVATQTISDFGITGTLDVQFRMTRDGPNVEPQIETLVHVQQGQIVHAALPFPLHEVAGEIAWDERGILIRNMTARNGITRLAVNGRIDRRETARPGHFNAQIWNLVLDDRLRGRLPAALQAAYHTIQPAGHIDLQCALHSDGDGTWSAQDVLLTAKGCSATHVEFPYPITGIVGTARQREQALEFSFEGLAGRRPIKIGGYLNNPGPAAESRFDISIDRWPLDDAFLAACPPEVRNTIRTLKLQGLADVRFRRYRPPGLDRKPQLQLAAKVDSGSLEYAGFPYRLNNLRGRLTYDSADDVWMFRDLKAGHGTARLNGAASFSQQNGPGLLQLRVDATEVQLDKQLELALPEQLQRIWEDLSPTGKLDLTTQVEWVPGRPAEISFPAVEVYEAGLMLKAFAYPLDDIRAECSYADGRVEIKSFTGKHDDTRVRAHGFAEVPPSGNWRLRLDEWHADDLVPDRLFRRALPEELRNAVEQLDPRGPLSLSGMSEIRGTGHGKGAVTAVWDAKAVFSGGSLSAGVDLTHISGEASAQGTWDGRLVDMSGTVELDSVLVNLMGREHQLTQVRGPYELYDRRLVLGSSKAFAPDFNSNDGPSIPFEKRVTARAIGGLLTLDLNVLLQDEPSYHFKMTMTGGKLEEYAARYLPGTNNLRGVMNGWIDLHGRGSSAEQTTGEGELQISPAALYELPIIMQIFRVISFVPPDKTAFTYAYLAFNVQRGRILFNPIDLMGDTIRLRGRGEAHFDGKLSLDFYSMLPRNRLAVLPVVNLVVGGVTSGWVGVEVRGHAAAPVAKIKPVKALDDALKLFLGAFDARPPGMVPRFVVPTLPAPPPRRAPEGQQNRAEPRP